VRSFRPSVFFLAFLLAVGFASCSERDGRVGQVSEFNGKPAFYLGNSAEKEVSRQFRELFAELGVADLYKEDPALAAASRNIAVSIRDSGIDRIPGFDNEAIKDVLMEMGVSDNAFRTVLFNVFSKKQAKDFLRRNLAKDLASGQFDHFGVGAAWSWWPPTWIVNVFLTRKSVRLETFPRVVAAGEEVSLQGQVLGEGGNLQLLVQGPKGTRTLAPTLLSGGFFFQPLAFFDEGSYRVELMIETEQGPEVAALFPLVVGEGEPGPTEKIPHVATASLAEARARRLTLINEARAKNDLLPVVLDKNVNRMAQGYAEEMRKTGVVAHVSPTSGDCAARASSAKIPFLRITENVAVNRTLEDVHQSFLESPAHRVNVLDPDVDVVGIGVAEGGENQVFAVENFARLK